MMDASVQDQGAADAGSHIDVQHAPCAAARSEKRLPESPGIGIIVEQGGGAEALCEEMAKGQVVPAGGVERAAHSAPLVVHGAAKAQTQGPNPQACPAQGAQGLLGQLVQHRQSRLRSSGFGHALLRREED